MAPSSLLETLIAPSSVGHPHRLGTLNGWLSRLPHGAHRPLAARRQRGLVRGEAAHRTPAPRRDAPAMLAVIHAASRAHLLGFLPQRARFAGGLRWRGGGRRFR